ncbi:hypothetical protein Drorol1_Dr00021921 [Drosera rotundifolia]
MPPFTPKTVILTKRPLFLFLHDHPLTTIHNRAFDDTSRNVRVSVWWDFENCGVPTGANVYRIAQWITAAVRGNGIKGPVQINAFGDVFLLSKAVQVGLSVTGVNLSHVPGGNHDSLDRPLPIDLMYWVSQNPPPAHLFIISGDKGMAGVLHRLRMNNYNILLACQDGPPNVLCSAASIMWCWNDLVRGENLAGKHFNLPPDGPFHSWYGNFKVPLEDPFTATETPSFSQNEDSIDELSSDAKIRQVPKVVLNAIQRIVNSYSNGVSITHLRDALVEAKVHIDKDFYGYKKFSCFLSSMPKILKVHPRRDGQFLITAASPRVIEPLELNSGVSDGTAAGGKIQDSSSPKANSEVDSVVKVVDQNPPVTSTLKSKPGASDVSSGNHSSQESKPPERNESVNSAAEVADKKAQLFSSLEVNEKAKTVKEISNRKLGHAVGESHETTRELSSNEVTEAQTTGNNTTSLEKQGSSAKVGILRRAWAKMFSRNSSDQNRQVSETRDRIHSKGEFEISNSLKDGSTGSSADSAHGSSLLCSTSGSMDGASDVAKNEAIEDLKGGMTRHGVFDDSNTSSGFLTKVIGWCKFWKRKSDADVSSQPLDAESKEMSGMGKDGLFVMDSLWKDTESFIESYKGSSIISNSRSREDIAQELQKTGPGTVQSLSMSDLLHVVDLLISEKKWIEECPSQTYPFRVIHPNQRNEVPAPTLSSNGLSSVFQHLSSKQPDTTELAENHEEKKAENIPRSGVGRKQARKSRTEILTDCRKLSEALLKASPEGFNLRSFRKLFVESYGYVLDHEKLGYPKLDSLLQIIPGVKVESGYARLIKSTPRVDHASSKGDDIESPWEELGPVEDAGDSKKEVNRDSSKVEYDYESLSDDELSDSELESWPLSQVEAQNNSATDGNDSSLLQILDSWYSNKEVNNSKDGAEEVDDTTTSPRHGCSKPNGSSQISVKQGNLKMGSPFDPDQRRGPAKSYSFVADSAEKEKDQLIDGILDNLKKAGESKLQV